jgi:hypothetical protein
MFGLTINTSKGKTELLIINAPGAPPLTTASGAHVPLTDSYKYLGWHLSMEMDWRADFKKRVKHAWFLTHSFSRVWKSNVPVTVKRNLFQAVIVPVLTYASFTYPATAECHRTMHTTCNALLRAALNTTIRWDNPETHMHTEVLYGDLPTLPAMQTFHLLTAFGHWVRDDLERDRDHAVFDILLAPPPTTGSRRTHTAHNLRSHLQHLTQLPSFEDVVECAQDRQRWRRAATSAAREVQLHMFRSWILPRRLGGCSDEEHSRVMSVVKANWTRWMAKRRPDPD